MEKNKNLFKILLGNNSALLSLSILLLRLVIGIILFVVGSGKVFGWFGGYGLQATVQYFSTKAGFAVPLVYLSCFTEFIGGLLLTIGLFTRPVAIAVLINMTVATVTMLPSGFLGPSGASYPFTFLIITIVIMLSGPMDYSVDSLIFGHFESKKSTNHILDRIKINS